MSGNDPTAKAAAGTRQAQVAALVGPGRTVLVVCAAPEELADELSGNGCTVTALDQPGAEWTSDLTDRMFDAVVLDDSALVGPAGAAAALAAAARRVVPGGQVVVVTTDGAHGLVVPTAPARVHDVEHDEVADLRHRLLTMRDHIIGLEAATTTARDAAARAQREAQQQLEDMAGSVTWRAGRAAVAPASWVRSRLAGRR